MEQSSEIIYEEKMAHSNLNNWKGFVLVVGIVFGVLALVMLVGFIEYYSRTVNGINIDYLHFILLGALLIACFFIVKFFLTNYHYYILSEGVVICQKLGKREKILADFGFGEIAYMGKFNSDSEPFTVGRKKERATYKAVTSKTDFIATRDKYILLDVSPEFFVKIKELKNKGN